MGSKHVESKMNLMFVWWKFLSSQKPQSDIIITMIIIFFFKWHTMAEHNEWIESLIAEKTELR